MKKFIFVVALLLFLCGIANAATYYVNVGTGSDAYDGTSATYTSGLVGPWKTTDRALPNYGGSGNVVTQGDTVYIASGTYPQFEYDLNTSGDGFSADTTVDAGRSGYITYEGTGATLPYFENTGSTYWKGGLNIDDATNCYFKFKNLHFLVDYAYGAGTKYSYGMVVDSSYVQFEDCKFEGPYNTGSMYYGFHISESSNITATGCEMWYGAYICFIDGKVDGRDGDCVNITLDDCYIHDTHDDGIYARGVTNLTINGCVIYNVNPEVWPVNHQDNMTLDDIATCTLTNNIIYVQSDKISMAQGIYATLDWGGANTNWVVENNLMYGRYLGKPLALWYVNGLELCNNTFDVAVCSTVIYTSCGLPSCSNVKIYNNIFNQYDITSYSGHPVYSANFDGITDRDYNVYEDYSGSTLYTNEVDSTAVTWLVNKSDYHLPLGSSMIDFGVANAYTPTTDLEGSARDANPDAGCYEYGAVAETPTIPTDVAASATALTTIRVTWTDSDYETSYEIQRTSDDGGEPNQSNWTVESNSVAANAVYYDDTNGLAENTTYHYRLRGENAVGDSAWSDIVFATTPYTPVAPSALGLTVVSSTQIDLDWTDNSDNETGFKVERAPDDAGSPGTFAQISTTAVSISAYSDTGLTAATKYHYRTRAYNAYANSTYCDDVNDTTDAAPSEPVEDPNIDVVARAVVKGSYLGDYEEDATVYFGWTAMATGGTIKVYKDAETAEVSGTTGITDVRNFDGMSGINMCVLDTSANAFYTAEHDYTVVLSAADYDGNDVNDVIALFSVENRYSTVTDLDLTSVVNTAIASATWSTTITDDIDSLDEKITSLNTSLIAVSDLIGLLPEEVASNENVNVNETKIDALAADLDALELSIMGTDGNDISEVIDLILLRTAGVRVGD